MELHPTPPSEPPPRALGPRDVVRSLTMRGVPRRAFPQQVMAYAALAVAVPVVLLGLAWNRCGFMGCPDVDRLSSYRPGGAPVVLDRRGFPIGDLAPVDGELVE